MIQIKMYPAKNGDCFLISAGDKVKKHILIDCGYVETYEKYLKKDLLKIAQRKEKINLMVVTHIDADHISGAIKFIEDNNRERYIHIDEVWFNAYRHLQIPKKSEVKLDDAELAILDREIALGKSFFRRVNEVGVAKKEISAKQGSTLGALLLQGNYNWNSMFGGKAVMTKGNQIINISNFKISILSPNEDKLKKLKEQWIKELKKKKWNFNINENELFDDAYEFMQLMIEEKLSIENKEISKNSQGDSIDALEDYIDKVYSIDESANNGSSIAILIEFKERKLLLLGDAHPDIILNRLKEIGEVSFDLVKIAHHGSYKNTTNELVEMLNSTKYIFSTNGAKHHHPDAPTIIKLLAANSTCNKQLYFNYKTKISSMFVNNSLQEKYNYEIVEGNGEEPLVIELLEE
ncbi:MBL fold metallo-hydrolase [Fictibacillus sp. JL2B1089]|uniref:MBL fold metallo-hydrolase n=1 Tax=Fictibacillus sp. JL2B1089 TaxID=3399565 RepID=UPI003A8BA07D